MAENQGELGRGSYGSVYKSMVDGEYIAVKSYSEEIDFNEIDVMTTREHKNILSAKTLLYGTAKREVEGETGAEEITVRDIKIGMDLGYSTQTEGLNKAKVMFDLIQGVQYLHRSGLIHGDIKIGNTIMVGNTAKIIDFGLCSACPLELLQEGLRSVRVKYTYTYRAPEICIAEMEGKIPIISAKSDVFALGWSIVNLFNHLYEVPKNKDQPLMLDNYIKWLGKDNSSLKVPERMRLKLEMMGDHALASYFYHSLRTKNPEDRESLLQAVIPENIENRNLIIYFLFSMLSWDPNERPVLKTIVDILKEDGLINYEVGTTGCDYPEGGILRIPVRGEIEDLAALIPSLDIMYLFMILELHSRLSEAVVIDFITGDEIDQPHKLLDYAVAYVFHALCPFAELEGYSESDGTYIKFPKKRTKSFKDAIDDQLYWISATKALSGQLASCNLIYTKCRNKEQMIDCVKLFLQGEDVPSISSTVNMKERVESKLMTISEILQYIK